MILGLSTPTLFGSPLVPIQPEDPHRPARPQPRE
jgi:hypothetical protein